MSFKRAMYRAGHSERENEATKVDKVSGSAKLTPLRSEPMEGAMVPRSSEDVLAQTSGSP